VFAFGSDDQLKVVATGGARTRDISLDVHTLFHRIKGDWTYRKGIFTSSFAPYVGYDLGSFTFGTTKVSADIYSGGGREDLSLAFSPHFTFRSGFDIFFEHLVGRAEIPLIGGTQYVSFPGDDPKAETQHLLQILNTFDGALYAETDFRFGPVTLTPGLRATAIRSVGHSLYALDPRFWAKVQVTDRATIKGSVGLYSQRPPSTDLIQAPFGNPNLGPERAFQTSLGALYRFTDTINLDVTGFFNRRFKNIVDPGDTIANADGSVTQLAYANAGIGRAYGLEVLLRHEVTAQFFGWIAYTLSRSEVRRTDTTDPYALSTFDQTHILTLVGSYRLPWGFELGARFRYVTGRPTTPTIHNYDVYSADSNSYSPVNGPTNSARLLDFHQLDLRLEKQFLFSNWSLSAYVDVQNVYNRKNAEASFYDYRFRQQYIVPGIPILPVLGVRGWF
jgi:outer membrane receptor for ferrienterochelin and colicin